MMKRSGAIVAAMLVAGAVGAPGLLRSSASPAAKAPAAERQAATFAPPVSAPASAMPTATIDPTTLGAPLFVERFHTLDAAEEPGENGPAHPHRWRTVLGYGGPAAKDNRGGGGSTTYIDAGFAGVRNGQVLAQPLGISPFRLEPGGGVSIVARRTPPDLKPILFGQPHISGILTSRHSFQASNAYFEIRAKLPSGNGLWPAFWLLPVGTKWPDGGEIDVFEYLAREPRTLYCSFVARTRNPGKQNRVALRFDPTADFHRYGVAYTPSEIVWYVDRREVARDPTPRDMNRPMFMLLNLAVGGPWAHEPDESTKLPAAFTITDVTVWPLK